jgi:hypothetical protein
MATKKITTTKKGNKRITTIIEETLKQATPQLTNHVVLLLDDSGSMGRCYNEAVRQINTNINNVKKEAAAHNQRTTVSLYLFGERIQRVYSRVPVEGVGELGFSFGQGRSTKLCDAITTAIDDGKTSPDAADLNTSFLLICATDGGENDSTWVNKERTAALIKEVQDTDRWTLAFMVPRGGTAEAVRWGIPRDNITEWENTVSDAIRVGGMTVNSTSQYYAARSVGATSTRKFYVETDLSKLTKSDLSKLEDLSAKFKSSTVEKEMDIKAFAEEKTGRPYVIGSLYYALTKKEKVQAAKEVLIMEKGKRTIYGGAQARGLIGLPIGDAATVTPGNHANFDVYVKSTSVNRKLVRGTKVLIDITKTMNDQETWDSVAAIAAAELKKAQATNGQSSST